MAGGIAQAYYKEIPGKIVEKVKYVLDIQLKTILLKAERLFAIKYKII
ncbi:MAG: hypothetical protein JXB88_06120 [Spirochaetales bacterium]|nr:hypothetical protein [Spirochaetales bacterium]